MSNEWKAFGDDRNTPLKRGDLLIARGGRTPWHFAYVTDDGKIATQEEGENARVHDVENFPGVQVKRFVGTFDARPSWKATAEILIAALESGTPTGKQLAREEIRRMGAMLDDMAKEKA